MADIGGGPGRYTDWLVEAGHRDARSLDLADASVDVVLLLGPLYHLVDRVDRVRVLREARRVLRPGGTVHAAAISRWSPRLDGMLAKRLHLVFPTMAEVVRDVERTGDLAPIVEGGFTGYVHRPDDLAQEVAVAGLEVESLVGLEGVAFALGDLDERWSDETGRALLLDTLRALEAVPELLGVSPHILATARKV